MDSNKKTAHQAGIIYLIVVITGIFSLMYVPSKLIVMDNAQLTFQHISESETLFRLGMVSNIICYTAFMMLALMLYQLLFTINKKYAMMMVVLALVSVPISFINLQNKYSILDLIGNPNIQSLYRADQLPLQVMMYLNQYANGISVVSLFWGLWLFPFGYLVFKSGILPKTLGLLLMAGCFGYVINLMGNTFSPHYSELGISGYISIPASLGEIGTCLWLLIVGAKEKNSFDGNA